MRSGLALFSGGRLQLCSSSHSSCLAAQTTAASLGFSCPTHTLSIRDSVSPPGLMPGHPVLFCVQPQLFPLTQPLPQPRTT